MGQQTFSHRYKRLSLVVLAAALGCFVLFLSIPRLYSSSVYLPVETALKNHWKHQQIRKERFPVLIGYANKSLSILEENRYWQGLGWLHYHYAIALGLNTMDGRRELELSAKAFSRQLQSSPTDSAEWLRLAWVRALLSQPERQVMDAWSMSVMTGRAEHYLLLDRLELGMRYIHACNDFEIEQLREQVRLAWKYRQKAFRQVLKSSRIDLKVLQQLLGQAEPELLAEMHELFDGHH